MALRDVEIFDRGIFVTSDWKWKVESQPKRGTI